MFPLILIGSATVLSFIGVYVSNKYDSSNPCAINTNLQGLTHEFERFLYGQHLVYDTVLDSLAAHIHQERSKKPLVLSFHGKTGTGKNYAASFIAKQLFANGMKNSNVHLFVSVREFTDKSKTAVYEADIRRRVEAGARKCNRAIFIFDEVDKMPPGLLASSLRTMLQYSDEDPTGLDYRKNIFIFLSNEAGKAISDVALKQLEAGNSRESLKLAHFERVIMSTAYNSSGSGFEKSVLMSKYLIDHYVPFLPLEKHHVEKCIHLYLRENGHTHLIRNQEAMDAIFGELQFSNEERFSSSGCKLVAAKTGKVVEKIRRENAREKQQKNTEH